MAITFDPAKRALTLQERGLDFAEAQLVFEGIHYTWIDERYDYGEKRMISIGYLRERLVVVGYVQRGEHRHIFSMRKANAREIKKFKYHLEAH